MNIINLKKKITLILNKSYKHFLLNDISNVNIINLELNENCISIIKEIELILKIKSDNMNINYDNKNHDEILLSLESDNKINEIIDCNLTYCNLFLNDTIYKMLINGNNIKTFYNYLLNYISSETINKIEECFNLEKYIINLNYINYVFDDNINTNTNFNLNLEDLKLDLIGIIFLEDIKNAININLFEYEKYDIKKYDLLLFSKLHKFKLNKDVKKFILLGFVFI